MQPTYLPWCGYFNMMSRVDTFVLLDTVQVSTPSWQHRNRILTAQGELFLTIPLRTAGRFGQRINETEIDYSRGFEKKHCRSIEMSYSRSKYFSWVFPEVAPLILGATPILSRHTEILIRKMAELLGISTNIILASSLNATGSGQTLTVNQLVELGADYFLSARDSAPYVSIEPGFAANGISVEFQDFVPHEYPQRSGKFVPYLSALDLLFNCGPDSRSYI